MTFQQRLSRLVARPLGILYHKPWPPSTAKPQRLDPAQPIEEERSPYYHPQRFHPTRLWDVLNNRYQIVAKLGNGSSSTVWLARDLCRIRWTKDRYVAIKIASSRQKSHDDGVNNELDILRHISKCNPKHPGWPFVRHLLDAFVVAGPNAEHLCTVFEPLREPLWIYRRRGTFDDRADLKTDNIMVRLEDPGIPAEVAQDEYSQPLPQKHLEDGRVIYLARNGFGRLGKPAGMICITDFDRAVLGTEAQSGCIQASDYRAPEVILDAGYSYSADIWNLGVMLWDLMEGVRLFNMTGKDTQVYDDVLHVAHITALLGPKPKAFPLGQRTELFYDPDDSFRFPELIPEDFSFESSVTCMQGEDKRLFIECARRMMKWKPEERSTAEELLQDPWLHFNTPDH